MQLQIYLRCFAFQIDAGRVRHFQRQIFDVQFFDIKCRLRLFWDAVSLIIFPCYLIDQAAVISTTQDTLTIQ